MKTTTDCYSGRVGSFKPAESYGFITIGSVSKADGSEHGLATTHDIFIHQDECAAPLQVGLDLMFQVVPDQVRGVSFFRAHTAEVVCAVELLPNEGTPIPGLALIATTQGKVALADARSPHFGMKEVPPEEVAKAAANEPLKGVPREEPPEVVLNGDPSQLSDLLSQYLFTQFPGLQNIGLTHQVTGFDAAAEEALVAEAVQNCRDLGMEEQAQLTEEEYKRYTAIRALLAWILEQGWLLPGARVSPAVIGSLVTLVRSIPNAAEKVETVGKLQQVFGFMASHGLLRSSTVLPLRHLPELFMAAPVWFFDLQGNESGTAGDLMDAKRRPDPQVQAATMDICALLPSNRRWHDVFQMFNRRCRSIKQFKGDVIPPSVIKLIREAREVFDRVVIMTPYLDIPGGDWMNLTWIRSIDPYVVGFKRGCPAFFVLARFSNTGVFPLLLELTADTMHFLRNNSQKLLSFNVANNPYWYSGNRDNTLLGNEPKLGTHLVALVAEMQRAYEAGHLFDWLRDEWTEEAFRKGERKVLIDLKERLTRTPASSS